MGDKDPGKKDADAKEKKKKRHALIKELQKQIDEQGKQIESLKLRLQNQLKDSIKIQTANRQMRRLWCVNYFYSKFDFYRLKKKKYLIRDWTTLHAHRFDFICSIKYNTDAISNYFFVRVIADQKIRVIYRLFRTNLHTSQALIDWLHAT